MEIQTVMTIHVLYENSIFKTEKERIEKYRVNGTCLIDLKISQERKARCFFPLDTYLLLNSFTILPSQNITSP